MLHIEIGGFSRAHHFAPTVASLVPEFATFCPLQGARLEAVLSRFVEYSPSFLFLFTPIVFVCFSCSVTSYREGVAYTVMHCGGELFIARRHAACQQKLECIYELIRKLPHCRATELLISSHARVSEYSFAQDPVLEAGYLLSLR
jgi:hypothetical protein